MNNSRIQYSKIANILIAILLSIVMFFPNTLQLLKLVIVFLLCLVKIFEGRYRASYKMIIWVLLYILLNSVFLASGELAGAPAFSVYWKVRILEPLLFIISLVPAMVDCDIQYIEKVMNIVMLAIVGYIACAFICFKLGISVSWLQLLPCGLTINSNSGYIEIDANNSVCIIYVIPYLIMNRIGAANNTKSVITVISAMVLALIIGRRAFIAIILLAFLMSWFLKIFIFGKNMLTKRRAMNIICFIFLALISTVFIWQHFGGELRLGNLNSSALLQSDSIRIQEIKDMLIAWNNKPIFGSGYGTIANGNVRSTVSGSYEYSYLAMLFQTGVVGSFLYIGLFGWLLLEFIYIGKSKWRYRADRVRSLAALLGLFGLLASNAFNPYLYSFDGMFYLFFSIGICNRYSRNNVYL